MTEEQGAAIYVVGVILSMIGIGVIARHDKHDRSFAPLAFLWPALAGIAAIAGLCWLLTEFGAWVGRKLPPKIES